MKKLRINQIADASALAATTAYSFTADHHRVMSVQAVYTSTTAAFSLALQYSNDGSNWEDFAAATAVSDDDGNVMWDVIDTADALYWQVKATRTSGTLDTLKAYVAYEPR